MGDNVDRRGRDQHGISRRDIVRYGAMGAGLITVGPLLAACGGDDGGSDTETGSGGTGGGGGGGGDNEFRVAFAYVGPTSDNGWTFQHDKARKAVESEYDNVTTSFVENIPFSAEATQIFDRLAREHDMVIVNTEYADLLSDVAERHPDTRFLECNGHTFLDNLGPYYVTHHHPAYVLGVAAGTITENGQLGYVGAFPTASTYNDVNAFLMGAQTVRPDARLNVVMINSFFDPPKATQAANALLDGGADVLFDIQDDTSVLQVCERRGAFSCIWNKDNREFGPTAYVNAIEVDFDAYYVSEVGKALNDEWEAPKEVALLGLEEGCDIVSWGESVPQEAQDAGNEARERILGGFEPYTGPIEDASGEVRVPEGESLTPNEAYSVDWAIAGITGV